MLKFNCKRGEWAGANFLKSKGGLFLTVFDRADEGVLSFATNDPK